MLRPTNPPWEYRQTRHYEDGAGDFCPDLKRSYFALRDARRAAEPEAPPSTSNQWPITASRN